MSVGRIGGFGVRTGRGLVSCLILVLGLLLTGVASAQGLQSLQAGQDPGLMAVQELSGAQSGAFPSLFNLSTRARVRAGDAILIGGFVVRGEAPKRVLIRARGPSLAAAGVANAMADPTLRLFSGATEVGYNDNWRDSQETEILATGRAPGYDAEAALIATLSPGPYTVHIEAAGGQTGVAIFEVIGIDEEPDIRLFNISTRAQVETGDDVAIGGFVIRGDTPKQVLLRGRGPTLAGLPAEAVLSDPTLELFSGGAAIAFNDDWQSSANAAAIAATGRAPNDAREAALLVTLEPGPYTAILRGAGGATGIGIVEVLAIDEDALALGVNQAVLGPLSGAAIRAYRLDDLGTPVEGPLTAEVSGDLEQAGRFGLTLPGVGPNEWILVTATGGFDIDPQDTGLPGATPVANQGTIHALARAGEWRQGGHSLNVLTDMAWHYSSPWVGEASAAALGRRLDEVARIVLEDDLDGDGEIDRRDLLAFQPANPGHTGSLTFDYDRLFGPDGLITALHEDAPAEDVRALLSDLFGPHLAFALPASFEEEVRVQLSGFGPGQVTSDRGGLVYDSELPGSGQQPLAFFERDDGTVTFTAHTGVDAALLSWNGCQWVSYDGSECGVDLQAHRLVEATFGYIDTTLATPFMDLTPATVLWAGAELDVTVPAEEVALLEQMDAATVGTVVAGTSNAGPFLQRILTLAPDGERRWLLQTEAATLEDVIAQGTGVLSRVLTHDDLAAPADWGFVHSLPDGVRFLPSVEREDPVFRFRLGEATRDPGLAGPLEEASGKLCWPTPEDAVICLDGEVEVEIGIDTAVGFSLLGGLRQFRFVPEVRVEPRLTLTGTASVKWEDELKLASLQFQPIRFFVGPVPVWVTPEVDVVLALEAKLDGELTTWVRYELSARAGVAYADEIWSEVRGFTRRLEYQAPTGGARGSAKASVAVEPALMIYNATGPGLSLAAFAEAQAKGALGAGDCLLAADTGLYGGLNGDFTWNTAGGDTKFGKLVGLDALNFRFRIFSWQHKIWGGQWDSCEPTPPVLSVTGSDIDTTVILGSGTVLETTYVLRNEGGKDLPWSVSYASDAMISVGPTSGVLAPGGQATVFVSLSTQGMGDGVYQRRLAFRNNYQGSTGQSHLGSSDRFVRVSVQSESPPVPTNLNPGSTVSPGPTLCSSVWFNLPEGDASTAYYVDIRDLTTGSTWALSGLQWYPPGFSRGLSYGRQYAWRKNACDWFGCSGYSAWHFFHTPAGSSLVPRTPCHLAPGGTTRPGPILDDLDLTIEWGGSSGTVDYHVRFWDLTRNQLWEDSLIESGFGGYFDPSTRYRWTVAACNDQGCSDYATPMYFQTPNSAPAP